MATSTAGTKTTSSLTALQWQPGGLAAADVATIAELIRTPTTGAYGSASARNLGYFENGCLVLPDRGSNYPMVRIPLQPGDYVMVDGAGWPVVVPASIFSTSWQHS